MKRVNLRMVIVVYDRDVVRCYSNWSECSRGEGISLYMLGRGLVYYGSKRIEMVEY